jgi:hypothetical protein
LTRFVARLYEDSLEDFENALTVSCALLALDLPDGAWAGRK